MRNYAGAALVAINSRPGLGFLKDEELVRRAFNLAEMMQAEEERRYGSSASIASARDSSDGSILTQTPSTKIAG